MKSAHRATAHAPVRKMPDRTNTIVCMNVWHEKITCEYKYIGMHLYSVYVYTDIYIYICMYVCMYMHHMQQPCRICIHTIQTKRVHTTVMHRPRADNVRPPGVLVTSIVETCFLIQDPVIVVGVLYYGKFVPPPPTKKLEDDCPESILPQVLFQKVYFAYHFRT